MERFKDLCQGMTQTWQGILDRPLSLGILLLLRVETQTKPAGPTWKGSATHGGQGKMSTRVGL